MDWLIRIVPIAAVIGALILTRELGVPWTIALPVGVVVLFGSQMLLSARAGVGSGRRTLPADLGPLGAPVKVETRVEIGPVNYSQLLAEAVQQLPNGVLVFNPAENMKVGQPETVVARVAATLSDALVQGLRGRGIPTASTITVGREMTAKLVGKAFDITALGNEDQVVAPDTFTEWAWRVVPQQSGSQTLSLLLAVRVRIDVTDARRDWPVLDKVITVQVNRAYSLKQFTAKYWKGALGGIVGSAALGVLIDHLLGGGSSNK